MHKKELKTKLLPFFLMLMSFSLIWLSIELFVEISENVVNEEIRVVDNAIIHIMNRNISSFFLNTMVYITELGSVWFITLISFIVLIYLWFKKHDKQGILFFLLTIGGGGLIVLILKNYYQIDRPSINAQIDAIGYSFPSGHAMGSLTLYGFIIYLVIKSTLSLIKKILFSTVLISIIALVSISRIYLSAHYPSDVIGGQASGLAWLLVCIITLELVRLKSRKNFPSV